MLARTSEAELALTSSTIDIEVIPVNSFDLIGMPHRHTDIVRNHKTRKLVAVDKDKLYRMLHARIFKRTFRKPRCCDEETFRCPRTRQCSHKCLKIGTPDACI